MASNFTGGKFQAIGSDGLALPGALLYTYAAGGLTPLATYTDQGGLSSNANPVVCDAAGQASVWLGASAYRMILRTAAGVTVWDVDNLSAGASVSDLSSTSSTSLGDAMVGVKLNATGAVATTQHQINEERVCVTRFMSAAQIASPSGVDCRDAVQAAVDYCLHADRGGHIPALEIPCFIRMDSAVNIDRPANTQVNEFRIIGNGRLGGFYTATAGINFFSSSIAHTTSPVSEWVSFEGIHFETNEASNLVNVMYGDKFQRVKFRDCYFLRVRVAQFSNYAQQWRFSLCQARQWSGWFFSCKGMYAVRTFANEFEQATAGKGFSEYDATFATGARGCAFIGDLFQGCEGPFLSLSSAQGVFIAGVYGEGNEAQLIDLAQGTTAGVAMVGNYVQSHADNIADSNFYEVEVGTCHGFFGAGNYTDGRMYDFTSATAYATIAGDRAQLDLSRGATAMSLPGNNIGGLLFPATASGSADVNALDDYEEGTWTPTLSGGANCTSLVATTATYTKVGRQVTVQMKGTFSVTAGTTITSLVATLPFTQGAVDDPALGSAMLTPGGVGICYDNTGANGTELFITFPANQVSTTGAQTWRASLTYNAAT
jgi:hypothetical protein